MDNTGTIKTVEWFFGYGGNHLGLKRAITNLQLVAVCEIEAFAICGILEKMEQGRIDPAPIWSDCKNFPSEPFKDRIDLFIASYPCQPFSSAGARKGDSDPRHLWPYVIDWVRSVRPTRCFFENVEGHISLGLSTVISDLESAGYKTTWGIFSASEVGAPHQRKRVFILAESKESIATRAISRLFKQHQYMRHMADAHGELWSEQTERWIDDSKARSAGENVADSGSEGSQGSKLGKGFDAKESPAPWATSKHGCICWPSRPGEPQHDWEPPRTINGTLNPYWVETLMGLEVGWTGTGNRIDRLRLLGNGVVPQTAELAYKTLLEKIK